MPRGVLYAYLNSCCTAFGVSVCLSDVSLLSVSYIHIGVGLSALLVSTDRVMRSPQNVKRAKVSGLHVFFCV